MTTNHDRPKVYRVQGLPDHPGFDRLAAARYVANAICDPTVTADDIHICSLATTAEPHKRWNRKVATVMFRRTPSALVTAVGATSSAASEWRFPVLEEIEPLVLDSHFLGLTVLNDVSVAEHNFDCIAISGLASHPFGSWQPKGDDKSYMWIRDTLPTNINGVRFILYGYDTTLKNSNSFQTIVDLANTLYLTLQTHGWASPSTKHLIFLAHSLGGVLLKQLIVMLAGANDKTRFMLSMIKGSIFFGTPSRGMALGQLLTMVGDQPNRELVEHLSETSGYLTSLETQFAGISQLQRMGLYWAYETKTSPTVQKMDGLYKRLGPRLIMVDRQSATGDRNLDPSLTIQIDEDHSDMVKFNRGDRRIPIIISKIQEICISGKEIDESDTTVTTMSVASDPHYSSDTSYSGPDLLEDARNSELVGWDYDLIISLLEAPERDQRHEQIDQNFGHTFSWAFENPKIGLSQWLRKGEGIFWINGKPGSGKSTFMKFLLNDSRTRELLHHWKSKPGRMTASFFFHHRGTHLQKSFEGLLKSLFSQLLSGDLRLHQIVADTQSGKAADLYESTQSDVNSFFKLFNKDHGSTSHQKRMVTLLSENPCLRLHRILEEEALHMWPSDRMSIKQTLLHSFDRLSSANRDGEAHVAEQQSACKRLLLQYPQHDQLIGAIVSRWCEVLDISGRIRKLLKEARIDILEPNVERHLIGLVERQKARLKRLINIHLMWWTQVDPEEGLHQIFNQNTFDLEVCLFFDALDEYDGTPEFISAFLKEVAEVKPTSKTRTKILFSSRPWTIFRDQFDNCPKIDIHEYTKDDIEQYCAGSLPVYGKAQTLIGPFVREVANRARGVFLWVKLVISDLAKLITTHDQSDREFSQMLRQCLDELPDELEDYYSTIIHRLPGSTRKQAYILLESLSRSSEPILIQQVPELLACGLSESPDEVQDAVESERAPGFEDPGRYVRTISGGLIELVSHHIYVPSEEKYNSASNYKLQLMHQTVKDWIALPTFKHTILSTRAGMTWQNGHSFLVKYHVHQMVYKRDPKSRSQTLEHALKSEMTTGISQYTYLSQLPRAVLASIVNDEVGSESQRSQGGGWGDQGGRRRWEMNSISQVKEKELEQRLALKRREAHVQWPLGHVIYGLELAALDGLSLYLQDSIKADKLAFKDPVGPLLSIALRNMRYMESVQHPDMVLRRFECMKLILENGFPIQSDPAALSLIYEGIWTSRDQQTVGMYMDLVVAAVQNGLSVGDRFDICLDPGSPTSLLHVSPPTLAEFLLENGADPNILNKAGQAPLDYILEAGSVFQRCALGLDWLSDVVRVLGGNEAQRRKGTERKKRLQRQRLPKELNENENGDNLNSFLSLRYNSTPVRLSPLILPNYRQDEVSGSRTTYGKGTVRNRLAKIFGKSGGSLRR